MYLQWTLFGSVYAVGGILLTVSEVAACCIVIVLESWCKAVMSDE